MIPSYDYWSNRGDKWHSLSPDLNVIRRNITRFVFLGGNHKIDSQVSVVVPKSQQYPQPVGNRFLYLKSNDSFKPYPANDECTLCINDGGRLAIISPCSHNGLLNIAQDCCNAMGTNDVALFVGGLHLLDGEADDIQALSLSISQQYPQMHLYTGHCTGGEACKSLADGLQERLHVFGTGDVVPLF